MVSFRKSYANIQFIDNEKEIDDYLQKQRNSNPEIDAISGGDDSILYLNFMRFPFVKDGKLILDEFKREESGTITFIDASNTKYRFKFYRDTTFIHFKVYFKNDSVDIDTKSTSLQNLDYAFLDVLPGGNKELVFLDDYYIMNGDNYDLKVYEIITR